MLNPFDVVECLGHFNGIIPSLAGILNNNMVSALENSS